MTKKISELPPAATVVAANEFEINEAGTSKKVTAAQIKTFMAVKETFQGFCNIGSHSTDLFWALVGGTVFTVTESNVQVAIRYAIQLQRMEFNAFGFGGTSQEMHFRDDGVNVGNSVLITGTGRTVGAVDSTNIAADSLVNLFDDIIGTGVTEFNWHITVEHN